MNLKIYQSFYLAEQIALLEKSFIPYNNIRNPNPELSEYPLILDLFSRNKNYDGYWGMMSWRFKEKTKISGDEFMKMISENSGYDVYQFNPFFNETTKHLNPFVEGEIHHPGIATFINKLLRLMGYNIDITTEKFDHEHFMYCSYYVGNQRFWEHWITFEETAMTIANSDQELNFFLYSQISKEHRGKKMINFSFVIERLVGLFLHLHKDQYKTKVFMNDTLGY